MEGGSSKPSGSRKNKKGKSHGLKNLVAGQEDLFGVEGEKSQSKGRTQSIDHIKTSVAIGKKRFRKVS